MQRRSPLLTVGGLNLKSGRRRTARDGWLRVKPGDSRIVAALDEALPYVEVSQAWLGTPVPAVTTVDAAATQSVGQFTLSANAQVYVTGTATQNVGAFAQSATGGPVVSGTASQTVGAFSQSATGGVYVTAQAAQTVDAFTQTATGDAPIAGTVSGSADQTVGAFGTDAAGSVEQSAGDVPARRTGGGAPGGARRVVVRIDDQEFIVDSAAEAQRLIAQAQALAEQTAREKAAELAAREKVRYRAARRAAPVIRIEAPDVPEVAAIREQVADVNAQIREMYESALRTALIARELQRRMEQDEEDALAALLL